VVSDNEMVEANGVRTVGAYDEGHVGTSSRVLAFHSHCFREAEVAGSLEVIGAFVCVPSSLPGIKNAVAEAGSAELPVRKTDNLTTFSYSKEATWRMLSL